MPVPLSFYRPKTLAAEFRAERSRKVMSRAILIGSVALNVILGLNLAAERHANRVPVLGAGK